MTKAISSKITFPMNDPKMKNSIDSLGFLRDGYWKDLFIEIDKKIEMYLSNNSNFCGIEELIKQIGSGYPSFDSGIQILNYLQEKAKSEYQTFEKSILENSSLINISQCWNRVTRIMKLLSQLFISWKNPSKEYRSILTIIMSYFRSSFKTDQIAFRAVKACLIDSIDSERKQCGSKTHFHIVFQMLIELGHQGTLVDSIIQEFIDHISGFSFPNNDYARSIALCHHVYKNNINIYDLTTENVKKIFSVAFSREIVNKVYHNSFVGVIQFVFKEKNLDAIRLLNDLVSNSTEHLMIQYTKGWQDVITAEMNTILNGSKIIEMILSLINDLAFISQQLQPNVKQAVYNSLKRSINDHDKNVCYHLSRFIHNQMMSSNYDDNLGNAMMVVLKNISEWSPFLEYHSFWLAKRLISYHGRIPEFEKEFNNHLKFFGEDKIVNIERMMVEANKVNLFLPHPETFPFHSMLISAEYWPKPPTEQLIYPNEIKTTYDQFSKYFKIHNPKKRLIYLNLLDECSFNIDSYSFSGSSLYFLVLKSIILKEPYSQYGIPTKYYIEVSSHLHKLGVVEKKSNEYEYIEYKGARKTIKLTPIQVYNPQQQLTTPHKEIFAKKKVFLIDTIPRVLKKNPGLIEISLFNLVSEEMVYSISKTDFDKAISFLLSQGTVLMDENLLFFANV